MSKIPSEISTRTELWCSKPFGNLGEIQCLLLGIDPLLIKDRFDFELTEKQKDTQRVAMDALDFLFDGTALSRRLSPLDAIAHFQKFGLEFPSELVASVSKNSKIPAPGDDRPTTHHEITALKRKQNSLQRLALVMAMAGYKYDPKKLTNPAINDIVSDADRLGLSISKDTVRSHLAAAARDLLVNDE